MGKIIWRIHIAKFSYLEKDFLCFLSLPVVAVIEHDSERKNMHKGICLAKAKRALIQYSRYKHKTGVGLSKLTILQARPTKIRITNSAFSLYAPLTS